MAAAPLGSPPDWTARLCHKIVAEDWDCKSVGKGFLGLRRERVETKRAEVDWASLMTKPDDVLIEGAFEPCRLVFYADGHPVLHERTEWWIACAGPSPDPYSDSTTLSFYSQKPMANALRDIFAEEAHTLGLKVDKRD